MDTPLHHWVVIYHLLGTYVNMCVFWCAAAVCTCRVRSLCAEEGALLIALLTFVESKLLLVGGSHERKGVALKLIIDLSRLVPVELIPLVLSERTVQCLVSIRGNPKHTLFELAAASLQEIVRGVVGSSAGSDHATSLCRLATANALILHGSAVFDVRTSTSTVGDLLQGLSVPMVLQHVTSLCDILGDTALRTGTDNEVDEDEESKTEGSIARAIAVVNALYALAKNSRITRRGDVCSIVLAVLVRLSCFGPGVTAAADSNSTGKKKGTKTPTKKKDRAIESAFAEWGVDSELSSQLVAAVHRIEKMAPDAWSYFNTTDSGECVATVAGSRLLALLAEMGHMGLQELNSDSSELPKEQNGPVGISLLHIATSLLLHIADTIPLRVEVADEGDAVENGHGKLLRQGLSSLKSLFDVPGVPPRLISSMDTLLCQSAFHVYCSGNVDSACLNVLCRVAPAIASGTSEKARAISKAATSEDSEEEEESLQTELFGACMDLLAVPGDHAVKGVRDAIKRAWGSVMQHCMPDSDVAEAMLLAVIGNDVAEVEDDEVDVAENMEGVGVDGGSSDGEEGSEESDDDKAMEDIMLDQDEMMHMLNNDSAEDDLSDNEGLTHHEGADAALAQLIQVKKQNRKKGLMLAKRQEFIVRSRAIDILEVFLHRNENALLVVPMFKPLLYCLKKVSTSSLCKGLQEGRAFHSRLRSLIESKVSHFGDAVRVCH